MFTNKLKKKKNKTTTNEMIKLYQFYLIVHNVRYVCSVRLLLFSFSQLRKTIRDTVCCFFFSNLSSIKNNSRTWFKRKKKKVRVFGTKTQRDEEEKNQIKYLEIFFPFAEGIFIKVKKQKCK